MGLFSDKKIISVSSTLYNMAGPEEDRPNFLKGTIFSSIIADRPSLADSLTNSYFNGPGIQQRQFFRYADRNDIAGLPAATVTNDAPVDGAVVAPHIPVPATPVGLETSVQNSQLTDGDVEPFIERWIIANHQSRLEESWLGEYDEGTQEFSVQFPNGDFFSFTDPSYDPDKRYVIAHYFQTIPSSEDPVVVGTDTTVTTQADLTGWTSVSSSGTVFSTTLARTADIVTVYSNNPSPVFTSEDASIPVDLNRSIDVYERYSTVASAGVEVQGLKETYTYTGDDQKVGGYTSTNTVVEDLGGGVTKTTTTTITGEQAQIQWTERLDTQNLYEGAVVGGNQIYIYEVGSGIPALDALAVEADTSNFQEFFPFLPLRINNKSLSENPYKNNGLYEETKKAYRRATDLKNIDNLLDDIEDNDAIDDIDYAYIMYGVSLNVQEEACRKYVFQFFQKMKQFQNSNSSSISDFLASINAYGAQQADLEAWTIATNNPSTPWVSKPPRPPIPEISVPPTTTIKLKSQSNIMPSYDIRIKWSHIEESLHNGAFTYTPVIGSARPAKKGELQFVNGPDINWTERKGFENLNGTFFESVDKTIPSLYLRWQVTDTQYRELLIYGLTHYNYIYGGKAVKTTSKEAMNDPDISGFVVPLHYPTMKEMSIVDYTQMATANVHVLFNSYTVTTVKWYEKAIFQILLMILVIVVAVIISPGTFAAGGGVLGGNVAIGTAIGFSGTAAIVAGVVANYLASIMISQLLSAVGTALFGEKWGALFAALATFAVGAVMSGTNIFSAEGLLGLGNALANGYAGWVRGDILEMQEEYDADLKRYERRMEYINNLIAGLGGNDLNFNPLFLTDSVEGNDSSRTGSGGYLPETADEFIQRTTMTGTDVIEVAQSMVYDFVEVQQTLPRN